MWFLLARKCVKNTNVLLSSIFFIAASVVNGYLMTLNASILQRKKKKIIEVAMRTSDLPPTTAIFAAEK